MKNIATATCSVINDNTRLKISKANFPVIKSEYKFIRLSYIHWHVIYLLFIGYIVILVPLMQNVSINGAWYTANAVYMKSMKLVLYLHFIS